MPIRIAIDRAALATFSRRWGIVEFALFGSVLGDDFRAESDVDVLATFEAGRQPSLDDLLQMQGELEELFGRKVDLLERNSLERNRNYLLRQHVLTHSEPVYVASHMADPKYLLDMLLAARDAQGVIAGLSQDQFEQNRTAQLAAAQALQIIGEAASRVSRPMQELHPEIPGAR